MKKHKIILNGNILPGSISPSMLKCGKENCSCTAKVPILHGPYYRWTGLINGKKTTVTIPPDLVKESIRRIDNYKKLLKILDDLKDDALKNAPWSTKNKKKT